MTKHRFTKSTSNSVFRIGDWLADPQAGSLIQDSNKINIEPKVMDLLLLLVDEPGRVYSRADIQLALWPDVVVGEDSLARTVSKLRRALGDSASSPSYVETIPKRGYRLIAKVSKPKNNRNVCVMAILIIVFVGFLALLGSKNHQDSIEFKSIPATENSKLTHRADDLYMQFTRADNEAAIALYEQVISNDSKNAQAQAGLANALVQRVVRWQNTPEDLQDDAPSLAKALRDGLTQTAKGREQLARATAIAEYAARLEPHNPDVLKALAFAYSARGELDRAAKIYRKAIELDENAWESLVNLGEIYLIQEQPVLSNEFFMRAFAAMDRVYAAEPQKVGPWQTSLGILIGDYHQMQGLSIDAEHWYRRVLKLTPLEPHATTRLVAVLRSSGRSLEADNLCAALLNRVGMFDGCADAVLD